MKTNLDLGTYDLRYEKGNAFEIMAFVSSNLEEHGYDELSKQYVKDATSGDYENLLKVTLEYVKIRFIQ